MNVRTIQKSGGRSSKTPANRSKTSPTRRLAPTKTTRVKLDFSDDFDLSIPTQTEAPVGTIETAKIFLHGEPGIGKSELAAQFPEALFGVFEPGLDWLDVRRLPRRGQFTKWQQWVTVIDNIVAGNEISTVIIDTADFAWDLCAKYICEMAGEDDINQGELAFNRGNKKLQAEFKLQIMRITATGRGVILISHTKSQEMQKVTGVKNDKLIATLDDKGRRFLNGFCDLTLCYAFHGDDRWLVIRPSESVDAKCRMKGHFMTPDGDQVYAIPMGESAEEAYENFMIAYNNEQGDPEQMSRKAELSEKKAVWGKGKK